MGDTETPTYEETRWMLDAMSEQIGEWQGIPTPLDGFPLRLCKDHPLAKFYDPPPVEVEVLVGGPSYDDNPPEDATTEELFRHASARWLEERIVNQWYDGKRNRDVYIFKKSNGRAFALAMPRAPDRSMDRLTLAMQTIGASDAWDIDAEIKAMEKLGTLTNVRQMRHYVLTGMFIETSKRSGLTYVFRRLRPTIALTPRKGDNMSVLAVLCLHPIGYYDRTWAGCLTPTDDVIAHLLLMRGDEAGFWRQANQHDPASPEAGL